MKKPFFATLDIQAYYSSAYLVQNKGFIYHVQRESSPLSTPRQTRHSKTLLSYILPYCPSLQSPKNPLQQQPTKNIHSRTLRTPTDTVPPPTIPPTSRIPHNLIIQISRSLAHRPTPTIRNNATSRPLPTRLDSQVLRLEFPLWV
jgi:hypothetical protein